MAFLWLVVEWSWWQTRPLCYEFITHLVRSSFPLPHISRDVWEEPARSLEETHTNWISDVFIVITNPSCLFNRHCLHRWLSLRRIKFLFGKGKWELMFLAQTCSQGQSIKQLRWSFNINETRKWAIQVSQHLCYTYKYTCTVVDVDSWQAAEVYMLIFFN